MKFNLWRIITIVAVSFLILIIWYLQELNESVKKNNALLVVEKTSLEKKINELYSQKAALESRLTETAKEKENLLNKAAEYEKNIKKFTDEIENIKGQLAAANDGITKKDTEIAALTKKISEYETSIASLKEKISLLSDSESGKEMKSGSTAEPAPITAASEAKRIDGKVIDVNKKYGFIVINIGRTSGIKKDDSLFVFRHDNMLGRVVVEKVGEEASIAKVLYKSLGDAVEKGDRISY